MANSESRLQGSGSTIIFSACDLPMTGLTGPMRDRIEAPHLLNRYAKSARDNAAARQFEDAGRA
ncbi:MAG TPA: hypothetical protein VHV99_29025 [Paraburkholderia sp.]|nr:hypothetical protein [Paraburkholderia sp.]